MIEDSNLLKLKTSWTKYDIVQVMEVIYNEETLKKFLNQEASINTSILKAFLGMDSLDGDIPSHWYEIQKHPKEKNLFALFGVIFTHYEIIDLFADVYSAGDMKGEFILYEGKKFTNLRSVLVESGASAPFLRRSKIVPFDFSPIFQNLEVGKLFKSLLKQRLESVYNRIIDDSEFYSICITNGFHKAISINEVNFKNWLEGIKVLETKYIKSVEIANFYSIKNTVLEFNSCREIYFLGENGDGKSLVLMALFLAFNRHYVKDQTDIDKTGKVLEVLKDNIDTKLVGVDNTGREYSHINVGYLSNFFAYGAHRGRFSADDYDEYGFNSLFDNDLKLINPVAWLKDQRLIELERALDSQNAVAEQKELPNSFPTAMLQAMFYELLEKNVKIIIEASEVRFIEKGSQLSFEKLSDGYKSVIIFMSDLLYRLHKNQPKVSSISELSGIVIVDEIDLHLHPKWQRSLISKLRRLLPEVQFIFSTHSPAIIQGASDDAIIYRVFRDADDNGETKLSDPFYRKDLNHLMLNTLVTSPLFGMDDSRMNKQNDNSNTSDSYIHYRINALVEKRIQEQKLQGKKFISIDEIDSIIDEVLNNEMTNNYDKDK